MDIRKTSEEDGNIRQQGKERRGQENREGQEVSTTCKKQMLEDTEGRYV